MNPLLVAGASLVTVALILLHAECDPEKLVNALGVPLIDDVIVLVFVRIALTVTESVLDTETVLEIRELTELVLDTVLVLVILGVNVCVTELVAVTDDFVVLVNVGQLVDVLLTIGEREPVDDILGV